jgi:hypothetical protein
MSRRRSNLAHVAAGLLALAAAPAAATEPGRITAERGPPEMSVEHLSRVVVLVEGPVMNVGEDARATLAAFAGRLRERGGSGVKVNIAGVVVGTREDERHTARARAQAVRDVLIASGQFGPSQIETGLVDRAAGAGTVEVAIAPAGAPSNLASPQHVASTSWRDRTTIVRTLAPPRGFHERREGNGCVHARHDLDDFQPGGPFLPCLPAR